jgi:hypothetical protein
MIVALLYLVIYLIIVGVVIWLLLYLVDNIPIPEPFHRVARVAIMVVGVLIVIVLLLNFVGIVPEPRMVR